MTMTRGNAIGFAVTLDGGGTCEFICDRRLTQRDYERLKALCHEFLEDVRAAATCWAADGTPVAANGQAPPPEAPEAAQRPGRGVAWPRGRVADYRMALRGHLLSKGEPCWPQELMRACSVPKGSFYYAIKHPWFVNTQGGFDLTEEGRAGMPAAAPAEAG